MSDVNEPAVSILICTRNRCAALGETLNALARVDVPADLPTELIVIDNGSTDDTSSVVRDSQLTNMPARYETETTRGQSRARNRGLAVAKGRYILFTDDDVRPPPNWISGMCAPLQRGECDAVAGGVRIAPHLLRPWMTRRDRAWLASTERIDPKRPMEIVGANFSFIRDVLRTVDGFDTELGPGARGFGDDSMFCWRMQRAGLRIGAALDVAVEHHFDPERLTRAAFLDTARRMGRTQGYLLRTWHKRKIPFAQLRALKALALLGLNRVTRWPSRSAEGIPDWEKSLIGNYHAYREYVRSAKECKPSADQALSFQFA